MTNNYDPDPLLELARAIAKNTPHPLCVAHLQRRLMIGYNRGMRLMETMIEEGLVERYDTAHGIGYRLAKPR